MLHDGCEVEEREFGPFLVQIILITKHPSLCLLLHLTSPNCAGNNQQEELYIRRDSGHPTEYRI